MEFRGHKKKILRYSIANYLEDVVSRSLDRPTTELTSGTADVDDHKMTRSEKPHPPFAPENRAGPGGVGDVAKIFHRSIGRSQTYCFSSRFSSSGQFDYAPRGLSDDSSPSLTASGATKDKNRIKSN